MSHIRKNKNLMIARKIIVEGGVYHITQRAPGREILFVEKGDYLRFLKLLKDTSKDFSIDIFCFALLTNHLHLLLKIKKKNLDKAMKYIFQSYAQYFNKKYERKGHVFCGAYRASFCQEDSHLIAASLYIHLNPYKAGLTSNVFNYKWFSLEPYIKFIKSSFLNVNFILEMLNEKDEHKARDIYKRLIKESVAFKYQNFFENKNAIKEFYEELTDWLKKDISRINIFKSNHFNSFFELEKKIDEVKSKGALTQPETQEAFVYIVDQLKARGYTYKDIAEKLGVGRATLYRALKTK